MKLKNLPNEFTGDIETTWNNIFYYISPLMVDEADESSLSKKLSDSIKNDALKRKIKKKDGDSVRYFRITDDCFQTIKIQLRALGLITKSIRKKSLKDTSTYWKLTPYGDNVMVRLRALRKD